MTANIAQILSHTGFFSGFAGQAQSIDLCSVSACDPHVEFYPDGPTATSVSAVVNCGGPLPGAICLQVPVADVGNPTSTSLLEEVGAYAFAGARKQSAITNPQAESDQLPLEIDGLCCFNFMASSSVVTPEVPWTPALALAGAALIGAAAFRRRRRRAAGLGDAADHAVGAGRPDAGTR